MSAFPRGVDSCPSGGRECDLRPRSYLAPMKGNGATGNAARCLVG